MLWTSARSFSRLGKLRIDFGRARQDHRRDQAGLGARARGSRATRAARPTAIAPTPTSRRISGGGARRSARSDGLDSGGIYLRRRRLRRVDLDLHSPVLRVVVRIGRIGRPVPADARRGELVGLKRRELPDDAPPSPSWRGCSDSSCTRLFGTWPFIDASLWPSITMRAAPYCPASFPTSSTMNPTFGS